MTTPEQYERVTLVRPKPSAGNMGVTGPWQEVGHVFRGVIDSDYESVTALLLPDQGDEVVVVLTREQASHTEAFLRASMSEQEDEIREVWKSTPVGQTAAALFDAIHILPALASLSQSTEGEKA